MNGEPGISAGIISGVLTTPNGTGSSPVPGATVSVIPDQKVTATTTATGAFSLTVPVGVYTVVFTKSPGITTTQVAGVSVVAGGTATVNQSVAYSPIALTLSGDTNPAGFGAPVNLSATATGATGTVTYAWTLTSGPYATAKKPTLVATGASASFTTNSFDDVVASGVVDYPSIWSNDPRPGFVALSYNQITQMGYTVTVTASDGVYSQSASTLVRPAVVNAGVITQGSAWVAPVGIMLVGNDPTSTSYAWTLTPPAGAPAAALSGATSRYPSFTPTAPGLWTLKNGATTLSVTAATYVGMGTFITSTADDVRRCSTCHASEANPPPEFAIWKRSAHGDYNFRNQSLPVLTMFEKQVGSGHYSGECLACHSVGFTAPELSVATQGNNGFADTMEAVGWSIPTTPTPTAFASMDPKLQALVGEQCENCHGPLSKHVSSPGVASAPTGTFAAATCLVCHDEPGHHEEPAMWSRSPTGHSNAKLAMDVATESANCGRCHSAQGFASWRKQVANGVSGDQPLQIPPNTPGFNTTSNWVAATSAYLDAIGLDEAHVQPQTCQACHDSHGTALRLNDATGMLPAGFSASGVGEGALCMTCHNSRVGRHGDGFVSDEHAPHAPTQADVLMGKNAYFVSGSNLSGHAFVAETCVGCHMKKLSTTLGTTGGTGIKYGNGASHTFRADTTICVNCHTGMTATTTAPSFPAPATQLQTEVDGALADLRAVMLAKIVAAVNPTPAVGTNRYWVVAQYDGYDPTGAIQDEKAYVAVALDDSDPIVALDVKGYHGGKAFVLTLKNPITITWAANDYGAGAPPTASTSTNELTVFVRDIDVGGAIAIDATGKYAITKPVVGSLKSGDADYGVMSKAIWNYLLIASDGSKGVHNPNFALGVLSATQDKVMSLTAIPY